MLKREEEENPKGEHLPLITLTTQQCLTDTDKTASTGGDVAFHTTVISQLRHTHTHKLLDKETFCWVLHRTFSRMLNVLLRQSSCLVSKYLTSSWPCFYQCDLFSVSGVFFQTENDKSFTDHHTSRWVCNETSSLWWYRVPNALLPLLFLISHA